MLGKNSHCGVIIVKDCSAYAWYSNKTGFIPRNSRIDDTERKIMAFLVVATRCDNYYMGKLNNVIF